MHYTYDWLSVDLKNVIVPDVQTGQKYIEELRKLSAELFEQMRSTDDNAEFKRISETRYQLKTVTLNIKSKVMAIAKRKIEGNQ